MKVKGEVESLAMELDIGGAPLEWQVLTIPKDLLERAEKHCEEEGMSLPFWVIMLMHRELKKVEDER